MQHSFSLFFLPLAAVLLIAGPLLMLLQKDAKRLLLFAAVGGAGYVLAFAGLTGWTKELVFHIIVYAFALLGAFAVLAPVGRAYGSTELEAFAGLYYRAPRTGAAMGLLALSLAGLPPTGGFAGQLLVLFEAAKAEAYWLLLAMAIGAVLTCCGFFRLAVRMYMRAAEREPDVVVRPARAAWVAVCAAASVLPGLFPGAILNGLAVLLN